MAISLNFRAIWLLCQLYTCEQTRDRKATQSMTPRWLVITFEPSGKNQRVFDDRSLAARRAGHRQPTKQQVLPDRRPLRRRDIWQTRDFKQANDGI